MVFAAFIDERSYEVDVDVDELWLWETCRFATV